MRVPVVAVSGLAAGVALSAAASAAGPTIALTPSRVHAGERVRVSGSAGGCPAGDAVTLISRAFPHTHDFAGVPAVSTPVRSNGRYRTSVRIPRSRAPRRYTLTARCGGGSFGVVRRLRVLAPASSPAGLRAAGLRIGDHPAFVRVVVDFSGAGRLTFGDLELQDAARLFAAGSARVVVRHPRVHGRLAAVRALGVRAHVTGASGRLVVSLSAAAGRFKALRERVLHGPERVVLDLWRAGPPAAGATVPSDGCLAIDSVTAARGRVGAHGRALMPLFENALSVQVRAADGRVVGHRQASPSGGRWRRTVPYTVTHAQPGTLEAVTFSAKDGSLQCLAQLPVALLP